jgi:uncharacterized membrane protein (UPF0127 family)
MREAASNKAWDPEARQRGEPRSSVPEDGGPPPYPPRPTRMKKLVLVAPDGQLVCNLCHLADRPHMRIRGVIGWKELRPGEGVLLRPSFAIHTAFVRFPIDVVFLDSQMKVVATTTRLRPWRIAATRRAHSVLELAAGECARLGIQVGDQVGWGRL